jgi:hypothetical protein
MAMNLAALCAVGFVGVDARVQMHSGMVPDGQGALVVLAVPALGCLVLVVACLVGLLADAALRTAPHAWMGQLAAAALIGAPLVAGVTWAADVESQAWRQARSDAALARGCMAQYDDLRALRDALPDAPFSDETSVARECWFGVGMGDVRRDGSVALGPGVLDDGPQL